MSVAPLWVPDTEIVHGGPDNTYRWATVTQVNPTRIRLDGDTADLPTTPETILSTAPSVGQRVWVQMFGRRILIIGGSQSLGGTNGYLSHIRETLSGGGIRTTSSTGISWSQRFIAIGTGRNQMGPDGYFEITMPPDGTVIPTYNQGGATVTVAGGVVPLVNWQALYYELPIGQTRLTQNDHFRIVYYTTAPDFEIPPHWVLVAVRNGDSRASAYKWGDGRTMDFWRTITLQNSWVAYGSGWPVPRWRFGNDGRVILGGLAKSGSIGIATPICTFGTDMAIETSSGVGAIFYQGANAGLMRVDVLGDGRVSAISAIAGGTNAFLTLEGIYWFPAGG